MGIIELFLIAVGLSMDAFAVAISKGLSLRKMSYKIALLTALFFGGFQALMPLFGYFLGARFETYITSIDHWIAFILLSFIGLKMIKESRGPCEVLDEGFDLKGMLLLSVATSIDALAVGITFAFLGVNIVPAITLIGITTFIISFCGVKIGNVFGECYKSKAELAGGIILILIGVKILLEHLNILP